MCKCLTRFFFSLAGLADRPVGTGTLYVLDRPPAEEEEANCCQPSTSKRARRSAGDGGSDG